MNSSVSLVLLWIVFFPLREVDDPSSHTMRKILTLPVVLPDFLYFSIPSFSGVSFGTLFAFPQPTVSHSWMLIEIIYGFSFVALKACFCLGHIRKVNRRR